MDVFASPPSSGKLKVHGWGRPTFTAADLKVCRSHFLLEVVAIKCSDARLSKMIQHHYILLYTVFMFF